MFKGVLGGFLTGTVLSGLFLGTASVLTGPPPATAPVTGTVEVPEDSGFNQPLEDREALMPGTEDTPTAGETPTVSVPERDDLTSLESADTDPAAQPQTGGEMAALTPPSETDGGASVAVDGDSAVLPSPQVLAPQEPSDEENLSISTEPAQPAEPQGEDAAFPEEAEDDQAAMDPAEPAEAAGDGTGTAAPDEGTEMAETAETAEPVEDPAATAPAQQPEVAEAVETDAAAEMSDGSQPSEPVEETSQSETSETVAATQGTIGDLADNVTTNRLPSVGDEPAETDEVAAEPAEADPNLPPLDRYAAEFENPDGKPLMAIVLLDDGQSPIGFDALLDFPYPISYAVDASWPGAADAAAKYRAAGLEVLAMVNLPEGASANDTEVAMQVHLEAVPEAVAIMEGTGTGLQASREASAQLVPILKESGHGLVMFPNGLNTAQKLIAREGVPAVSVFRDFDAKGQNTTVIRRFLDQAAFKAGTEPGGVIMVGRLKAETVSALLLWGLQDRAGSVALAPVSAVLKAERQ